MNRPFHHPETFTCYLWNFTSLLHQNVSRRTFRKYAFTWNHFVVSTVQTIQTVINASWHHYDITFCWKATLSWDFTNAKEEHVALSIHFFSFEKALSSVYAYRVCIMNKNSKIMKMVAFSICGSLYASLRKKTRSLQIPYRIYVWIVSLIRN